MSQELEGSRQCAGCQEMIDTSYYIVGARYVHRLCRGCNSRVQLVIDRQVEAIRQGEELVLSRSSALGGTLDAGGSMSLG